jgi:hypothetical protein
LQQALDTENGATSDVFSLNRSNFKNGDEKKVNNQQGGTDPMV